MVKIKIVRMNRMIHASHRIELRGYDNSDVM